VVFPDLVGETHVVLYAIERVALFGSAQIKQSLLKQVLTIVLVCTFPDQKTPYLLSNLFGPMRDA